jgi:hypothetical protein
MGFTQTLDCGKHGDSVGVASPRSQQQGAVPYHVITGRSQSQTSLQFRVIMLRSRGGVGGTFTLIDICYFMTLPIIHVLNRSLQVLNRKVQVLTRCDRALEAYQFKHIIACSILLKDSLMKF